MLTVISMDRGHKIDELFTGDGAQQLKEFHDRLKASGEVEAVVSPLTILRFSDSLVSSPDGNPTTSPRPRRCSRRRRGNPGSPAAARARTVATLERLIEVPAAGARSTTPSG
jgi:hypothetical protein